MSLDQFTPILFTVPRRWKKVAFLLIDVQICFAATWLAFSVRFDELVPFTKTLLLVGGGSVLLAIPIFVSTGFYRAIFRFSGWHAALTLARAVCLYTVLFAMLFSVFGVSDVPRSIGIIQPLFLFVGIGASRLLAKLLLDRLLSTQQHVDPRSALIYGGGSAGRQLAAALLQGSEIKPVGFLDDDPHLWGGYIYGLPVYSPSNVPNLLQSNRGITDILLAIPNAGRSRQKSVLKTLSDFPVHVRMLPSYSDLANGAIRVENIREVEIDDVLGRDPVEPDHKLMHQSLTGKVVLVTGAGGSIGSELCRQILDMNPSVLILLDLSEYALYSIEYELVRRATKIKIVPILGSVLDESLMTRIMTRYQVQTLYHAAAYKHVPMIEANPAAGVWNNAFGTLSAVKSACEARVETFVLVSTDKAVRPTNIMGCTKRIAELVLQAKSLLNDKLGVYGTKLAIVRFGNVLGSSGSVVPIFREQIRAGGPVTVTDPEVVRYFMTIPEAAQLVIQAGAMSEGGDVMVLDMGEPVKILDLAKRMIHLSGFSHKDESNPSGDIEIRFTGLRSGEKLYEELLINEDTIKTFHSGIMRAKERAMDWEQIEPLLAQLERSTKEENFNEMTALLKSIVPEFNPRFFGNG